LAERLSRLSRFTHFALVPAQDPGPDGAGRTLAIAVLFTVAGLIGFAYRDLGG